MNTSGFSSFGITRITKKRKRYKELSIAILLFLQKEKVGTEPGTSEIALALDAKTQPVINVLKILDELDLVKRERRKNHDRKHHFVYSITSFGEDLLKRRGSKG